MRKKSKIILGLAISATIPAVLTGCEHNHDYGTQLKSNESQHYYECSCGEKKDAENHEVTGTWITTDTHHFKECNDCGYDIDYATHAFNQEVVTDDYLKTAATTTTKAVYWKSCICGVKSNTETFESGKLLADMANVTMSSDEIVYGDNYSVSNIDGEATIEYKFLGEDDEMYSESKPTNVGRYTARVTVAETNTHATTIKTIDFEIKPKKLENLQTTVTYNGQSFHEIDLSHIEDGLTMHVMFDSADVGATTTGALVYLNGVDTFNYEVVTSGDNACRVEIVAKELVLNWIAPEEFGFSGGMYETMPSLELEGVIPGDYCNYDIELNSGSNLWLGDTFTYKLKCIYGQDYDDEVINYKLPDNIISPTYSVTCKEIELGTPISITHLGEMGSDYYAVYLEEGSYTLSLNQTTEEACFIVSLFKNRDSNHSVIQSLDQGCSQSITFTINESGQYYISVYQVNDINAQGDTFTFTSNS